MAICATITLTEASQYSGNFSLYSDVDDYTTPFETGVYRLSLIGGYQTQLIPDGSTIVRVESNGLCSNYVDIPISGLPDPTPTPTPTPVPITLSVGSQTIVSNMGPSRETYFIINHANHGAGNDLVINFNYAFSGNASTTDEVEISMSYTIDGGTPNLLEDLIIPANTSGSESGSFSISGITSSNVVRLYTNIDITLGYTFGYVETDFTITGGSASAGTVILGTPLTGSFSTDD